MRDGDETSVITDTTNKRVFAAAENRWTDDGVMFETAEEVNGFIELLSKAKETVWPAAQSASGFAQRTFNTNMERKTND